MMRKRHKKHFAQPEITLTPLIDTALTLLIIFMVTTPIIQNSLKIDLQLPKGHAQEAGTVMKQELVVSIDKDEHIYFNDVLVTLDNLGKIIKEHLAAKNDKQDQRVWVRVDKRESCSANTLICVIDQIKALGGIKDVAIATEKVAVRAA